MSSHDGNDRLCGGPGRDRLLGGPGDDVLRGQRDWWHVDEEGSTERVGDHLIGDGPEQQARDQAMATSGDRSIANIGWLYLHDAAAV